MKNKKPNFWLMLLVGVAAFVWLFAELVRVFLEVVHRSGIPSVPLDGVIQHKVGELMVAGPLFLIVLLGNIWPKGKLAALADRARVVMVVGGLLNGLAWYSVRDRMAAGSFFRVWCLVLLVVGLFGARIAKWLVSKSKGKVNETNSPPNY